MSVFTILRQCINADPQTGLWHGFARRAYIYTLEVEGRAVDHKRLLVQ